ncbi:hypothetical protein [Palaeococcus ferrophilus]|uniref:hypothetical protein n=1 Tax=Palaeococcus ferrophilus TaxID=83868 RepID=UPI00064E7DD5|nr:hypothetical protein [Palaeococcus ferrophilus]
MRRSVILAVFLLFAIALLLSSSPQLSVYHEILLNNNPAETSKALCCTANNLTFMVTTNMNSKCSISISSNPGGSITIEPKNIVFVAEKNQREPVTFKITPMGKNRYIVSYEIECNSTGFRRSYLSSSGQFVLYIKG